MKFAAAMFLAWMTLIIISGCSNEEPVDFSNERARIRRPIKRPPQDIKTKEVSKTFRAVTAPEKKISNTTGPSGKKETKKHIKAINF